MSLSKEQVFYNLENSVTENLQVGEGVLLNQSSQDKVYDKEENKLNAFPESQKYWWEGFSEGV